VGTFGVSERIKDTHAITIMLQQMDHRKDYVHMVLLS
jgi:hypothetical protein